jgi:hypothetical protein
LNLRKFYSVDCKRKFISRSHSRFVFRFLPQLRSMEKLAVLLLTLGCLGACGGPAFTSGSTGEQNTGGSTSQTQGGSGGSAGENAMAGRAGQAGESTAGGSAGSAGEAGTNGMGGGNPAGGQAGQSMGGSSGTSGTGGASGTSGSSGTSGTSGSSGTGGSTQVVNNLIFSEYIEGTENNKALEIYNLGDTIVNLSTCNIRIYLQDNINSPSNPIIDLTGILGPKDTFTLCQDKSAVVIDPKKCDMPVPNDLFNGDDAIELRCDDLRQDIFGSYKKPLTPGWEFMGHSTINETWRRKCTVKIGDRNGMDMFNPGDEWDPYPVDTFDDLGIYNCPVSTMP